MNQSPEKLHLAFQRLLMRLFPQELFYIGGPDPLPPPLTPEEERALALRLKEHDEAARRTLIEHNLRLVVFIARRFENTGIPLEDLISIGTIGLIKAVGTFDAEKKIKMATYASRCIENEILMFLRKTSKLRLEVSLDEPLKTDWDGNELLLSDVLGDPAGHGIGQSRPGNRARDPARCAGASGRAGKKRIIMLRFGLGRPARAHPEGSRRPAGHFPELHLAAGRKRILSRLHTELKRIG